MKFNLLGCGFLFLFLAILGPFTLLRHFIPGSDFYGYVLGCLVAAPVVCLLDIRMRLNSRTDEEIETSNADCMVDFQRGGMLGCLPVWIVVWVFPFLMYEEFGGKSQPPAAPVAVATSSLPRAAPGENYNLSLANAALKKKDYNAVLTWAQLALSENLAPQQRLRALSVQATAHEKLKQFTAACTDYKECLKLDPTNHELKVKLKRCLAAAKKH